MYRKVCAWLCQRIYDARWVMHCRTVDHEMNNAPWSIWVLLYHPVIEVRLAHLECRLGKLSRQKAGELFPPF